MGNILYLNLHREYFAKIVAGTPGMQNGELRRLSGRVLKIKRWKL